MAREEDMNRARRWALPAAIVALLAGAAQAEPVKLGVLTDMSGPFSDLSGKGSVEAARLAIEEFGGQVLGQKIELVFADHQQKPEVGLNIARQWLDEARSTSSSTCRIPASRSRSTRSLRRRTRSRLR
jgi:branched-chain amino acid transport system substrate-binding protein